MPDALLTQLSIIAIMTGTPGPNNVLLMSTGAHFGVRRSLPLVAGIVFGCVVMLLSTAAGIGQLFSLYPMSHTLLSLASAAFLGYLTVTLLRPVSAIHKAPAPVRPWSLWQGAAFQWLNPKAWMMCLALASTNGQGTTASSAIALAFVFALMATPLLLSWSAGGQYLAHWLQQAERMRWFNRAMAASLLACAIGLLLH